LLLLFFFFQRLELETKKTISDIVCLFIFSEPVV